MTAADKPIKHTMTTTSPQSASQVPAKQPPDLSGENMCLPCVGAPGPNISYTVVSRIFSSQISKYSVIHYYITLQNSILLGACIGQSSELFVL